MSDRSHRLPDHLRYHKAKVIIVLIILSLIVIPISIFVGMVWVSPIDLIDARCLDIIRLRSLRVILGFVCGASLSVAGCVLQGLLRNPLAEPYVLGVSSGAALGAVSCIALGLSGGWFGLGLLPLTAFLGAILTMILVYNLAKTDGQIPVPSLLLSGVIVGAVFASILMFIIYTSKSQALHSIIWWLLGNLEIFDINLLIMVGVIASICIGACYLFWRDLNIISLGEEPATHLGIEVQNLKRVLFILASLLTAACVSACGLIGFVGLIVPHTMRLIVGPNHRVLIPSSALAGGLFLMVSDLFARTIFPPAGVPIGVITAIIGGPFFIFLLRRKGKVQ